MLGSSVLRPDIFKIHWQVLH